MKNYILKRLLLLPLTLFLIVIVNFVIINLAPGEPVYMTEVGKGGEASMREGKLGFSATDERYLQFRHFFGLTLPLFFNTWPSLTRKDVRSHLYGLTYKKDPEKKELSASSFSDLKIKTGDQAAYTLPHLFSIMDDEKEELEMRVLALYFFIRGASQFSHVGPALTNAQKEENKRIGDRNYFFDKFRKELPKTKEEIKNVCLQIENWHQKNSISLHSNFSFFEKIHLFFFDTRLVKYCSRIILLDFGTLRQDANRYVIDEVISRLKYSLTLSLIPMVITFFLCQFFGLLMALYANKAVDLALNSLFLLLYATPVFVVAPFLIERVALHHTFPFTDYPFPLRGFTSNESLFTSMTSLERLGDILRHITLPLLALLYGSLAVQSRLSKALFIDTLHQDYVRQAIAKGVNPFKLYVIHVGKNAAIPILTSVATSLGVLLGGSIIVETIFEINGFGKFFYDAIIERDYNVMMFSALTSAFLSLVGYLLADILYMYLDPRVSFQQKSE